MVSRAYHILTCYRIASRLLGNVQKQHVAFGVMSIVLLLCAHASAWATNYFYQSGDPSLLANWNTLLGGGGSTPPNFTTMTDQFIIPNGRTATLVSNLSFGANVLLRVEAGGVLDAQTFSFTGAGDFQLQAGARLITAHVNGVNGGAIQNTGARMYSPTALYTFNAAVPVQNAGFLPGMPIGAAQSIIVNNQASPTPGSLVFDNSITVTGTLTIQRGTLDCGMGLNHTFMGGVGSVIVSTGTVFLRRTGTITAPAGTFVYHTGTPNGQLRYDNGMNMLVIASAELPSIMPGNVVIANATILQLSAPTTINGSLTIEGSLNLGATSLINNGALNVGALGMIDMNAGSWTWNGAVTLASGCVLQDNSAGGGAVLTVSGTGALVGAISWFGSIQHLGTLTLNRAGTTLNVQGTLPVANLLSLQQGILAAGQVSIESTSVTSIVGGSPSSFVVGQLRRRLPPSQMFTTTYSFPVGVGGLYMPIYINGAATGAGAPAVIVEALSGLTTGVPGLGIASLSSLYWQIQPAALGDYTQIAIALLQATAIPLVSSSTFAGANATNATFSLIPSIVSGMTLLSQRFAVNAAGPTFFAIGNTTPVPVITGFTPSTGGQATVATITGLHFTGASQVRFGGVPAQSFEVLSPTTIRAVVAHGSTGSVSVTTIGGTGFSSTTFVYAPPPQITLVSPTIGSTNTVVSLRGRNLSSTATVTFGGQTMPIIFRSDTLVQVRCPSTDVSGAIFLGTPGGRASTTSTFTFIVQPVIASFTPAAGTFRDVVRITGAHLSFTTSVTIGGVPVIAFTINSSTQLSVVIANGSTGTIIVRTPAGEARSEQPFFYAQQPKITEVLFNGIPTNTALAGSTLLVRGQHLLFAQHAQIGQVTAPIVSVLSSTEITIRLPLNHTTSGVLSITTPGGTARMTVPFTVLPALAITDVTPTSGTSGSVLTITGRNFTPDVVVRIAGTSASSTLVLSTTQIIAVVGHIAPGVTSGTISVSSTLGTFSSTAQFIVAPVRPVIAAVSPSVATIGSIVQVRGQFLTGLRDVRIGGGRAEIVRSVSPTELLVRVTESSSSGTITITTLGGTTTSTVQLTIIPAPFITDIFPPFAVSGATVTVRGGNFTGTHTVLFGSSLVRFSVVSDSVIRAVVSSESSGIVRIVGERGIAQSSLPFRVVSVADYEREILRVVYDSLDGMSWSNRRTNRWLSSAPLAEWQGITVENGRVTQIRLPSNGLRGRLPEVLTELTELKVLDLTDNVIRGEFPSWIVRLSRLEELRLGSNELTGKLPESLGVALQNLRVLTAERNRLDGRIPPTLCSLRTLRVFNVRHNAIDGEIPPCVEALQSLDTLDLAHNMLAGTLPPAIGNLRNLRALYLQHNRLTGSIPSSLGSVGSNTGAVLPTENIAKASSFLSTSASLRSLWLGHNQFTGRIPATLRLLVNLEELMLEHNRFEGEILDALVGLRHLRMIDIRNNRFVGTIPPSLGKLRRLRVLSLSHNLLTGTLPETLGNLDTLETLLLDSNAFSGVVPQQVGSLARLRTVGLSWNQFTGLPRMSPFIARLAVEGNKLQFGDIQPNLVISNFTYVPQDSIGVARDTGIVIGAPMLLSMNVSGRENVYQWFKDGQALHEPNSSPSFRRDEFQEQDTGTYVCAVTNRFVERLTLVSRPLRVYAIEPLPPRDAPSLVFPRQGTQFVAFAPVLQWTRVAHAVRYEVQVSQLQDFAFLARTAKVASADTTLTIVTGRIEGLEPSTLYFWRVRALNGREVAGPWSPIQSFTTAPTGTPITLSSLNFGRVTLGQARAETIFLTNLTRERLVILDVDGNDTEFSFRIPLDVRLLRLDADQTITIPGVVFAPRSPGRKIATITITCVRASGDTVRVRFDKALQGQGTPFYADTVYFDTVRLGRVAQTLALVSNRGGSSTRLSIDKAEVLYPSYGVSVESLEKPLYIGGGATSSVIVRMLPTTTGIVSALLRYTARYTHPLQNGRDTTYYDTVLVPVRAYVRDTLLTDVVCAVGVRPARGQEHMPPGSSVRMEVYVVSGDLGNLIQIQPLSYSIIVRFNRRVLSLSPTNPSTVRVLANPDPRDDRQRIAVTVGTVSSLGQLVRDSVIVRFTCLAVAGDTTATPLEIEYFRFAVDTSRFYGFPQPLSPTQPRVFVEGIQNGTFRIRASTAGGTRYVTQTLTVTTATLSRIQPHPVVDIAYATVNLPNPSPVTAVLVDVFGREISTLVEHANAVGELLVPVPVQHIPSGTYFIIVRTPVAILTERIQVRR
ncbi:MAG: IPT/TIG domain-containing protein [Bacteroidota bacterium]|nr:IPT/TIG domain-containing protein [Candidatus Kapabacteria bacterium]MDW8220998.1 IPT/TIG domain-containing protein [Bacteroidota bacterium]